MGTERSSSIFARAQAVIPGGVNSPVRACRQVGCEPLFIARGEGSRVYDADGNEYLDLVGSWGPLILGHAHPEVLDAIARTMANGTTFGAPTEIEVDFAEDLDGLQAKMLSQETRERFLNIAKALEEAQEHLGRHIGRTGGRGQPRGKFS